MKRTRLDPNLTPERAFNSSTILTLTFSSAILMYFGVGEIMKASIFDNGGFVDLSTAAIWGLRALFVFLSLSQQVMLRTLLASDQIVDRLVAQAEDATDAMVAGGLQTVHILRLTFTESIAIYGLVLFELNGSRYDLFGFGLVALLILVLTRPNRDEWEATFRRIALDHPGVTSSPWTPRL